MAQSSRQFGEFARVGLRALGSTLFFGGSAFRELLRFAFDPCSGFSRARCHTFGIKFFLCFVQSFDFGIAARLRLLAQGGFGSNARTCGFGRFFVDTRAAFEFLACGVFDLRAFGSAGTRMRFPGESRISGVTGAGFGFSTCDRFLDRIEIVAVGRS
jgi:hypothetical protein